MGRLVYDEQNDQEVKMQRIAINDRDKAFLQALLDTDGWMTTHQIKQATGLDLDSVHYRYDKFARERYTKLVKLRDAQADYLPPHQRDMLEARLTNRGKTLLNMGLMGNPTEKYRDQKVTLDEEDYENLCNQLDQLENQVNALHNQVSQNDDSLREVRATVESLDGWRSRINTFVIATKLALQQLDIDVSDCLREARKETKRRRNET
jgi:hypothetical protein